MGRKTDVALAILNGALGDYLARTGNGLATRMCFTQGGRAAAKVRGSGPRLVVLVHGLMTTESIWTMEDGADYGSLLAGDLGLAPLYLRYNSGLPIADNGAALARLLDGLVASWPVPVEEVVLLGYSMGGLVIRSACHAGSLQQHEWLRRVSRAIYVGTPHLGAPFERAGRLVTQILKAVDDPYTRLVGDLADLRSGGLKDLGHADIRHEDRALKRPPLGLRDPWHPVPLLPSIRHYLVAGSLSATPLLASLFGDLLVPVPSATDGVCRTADSMALPPSHVKILHGVSHLELPRRRDVYEHIRAFCAEDRA